MSTPPWSEPQTTALLVLADGTVIEGMGFGASGAAAGEVCFNTTMTGYQEILTDPSYAGQIITFTFPHIGNVGTNVEDMEATTPVARGLVVKQDVSPVGRGLDTAKRHRESQTALDAIRALIADDSPHARAFLAECEGDRVQGDTDACADNRPVDADELQVASEQQLKLG